MLVGVQMDLKRFFQINFHAGGVIYRAQQRAGRPGPEIFDPGFQNPGFFNPEKNLILNPEPGPDLKFSPEPGPDPEFRVRAGPKNPARNLYPGFLRVPEPAAQPGTRPETRIFKFSARKNPAVCRALVKTGVSTGLGGRELGVTLTDFRLLGILNLSYTSKKT